MKRSSEPRKLANGSDSVPRNLNMYALAAGAAGVSMLALAQPADAKIVYTPTNVKFGEGSTYNLDLNHDGITDFVIDNVNNNGWCKGRRWRNYYLIAKPANHGNGVVARFSSFASALYRGAQIGPS